MNQPPPIPKPPVPADCFPRQAALVSLLMPVVAVPAGIALLVVIAAQSAEHKLWARVIVDGAAGVMCLIGLVFGFLALSGLRRYRTGGPLSQALIGTLLNGMLLVLALVLVPTLLRQKARAEAAIKSMAKVNATSQRLQEATRANLRDGSNNVATERLAELQKSLSDAAQNLSGNDALVAQAGSAYLEKLNVLRKELEDKAAQLKSAKILMPGSITNREQLKARREIALAFLEANEKLKTFIAHGEENMHAELQRVQVPESALEVAEKGFQEKVRPAYPVLLRIRDTDTQIARGMLGLIDLEETNWGHWTVSGTNNNRIRFEDEEHVRDYNASLKQIREASAEQSRLQKKLLVTSEAN